MSKIELIVGSILFVLGTVADIYTSKRGLEDRSIHLREKSSVGAWFYHRWGWYGFILEKAIWVGIVCLIGHFTGWEGVGIGLGGAGLLFLFQGWRNRRLIQQQRAQK